MVDSTELTAGWQRDSSFSLLDVMLYRKNDSLEFEFNLVLFSFKEMKYICTIYKTKFYLFNVRDPIRCKQPGQCTYMAQLNWFTGAILHFLTRFGQF